MIPSRERSSSVIGVAPEPAPPALTFTVEGAEPVRHAAVPTLRFLLRIDAASDRPIRSILLDAQIQIAARQRAYDHPPQGGLLELFGSPERWSATLRTLPWTRTTLIVPPFTGSTTVDLLVGCTYDFEVSAARYLASLPDGEVPLEFLFSGTVFFLAPDGRLQTVRIALDHDVNHRLPVRMWREAMDRHFPNSAWLRLSRESFDRLCAFKGAHAFATWEAAIDALLARAPQPGAVALEEGEQ